MGQPVAEIVRQWMQSKRLRQNSYHHDFTTEALIKASPDELAEPRVMAAREMGELQLRCDPRRDGDPFVVGVINPLTGPGMFRATLEDGGAQGGATNTSLLAWSDGIITWTVTRTLPDGRTIFWK